MLISKPRHFKRVEEGKSKRFLQHQKPVKLKWCYVDDIHIITFLRLDVYRILNRRNA